MCVGEAIMNELVVSLRVCLLRRNWYPSLALALALPDICGFLESPTHTSKRRYVDWCDLFLVPRYSSEIGPDHQSFVFLSGEDCYALRCAFLHQGSDSIEKQSARDVLDKFIFVEPPPRGRIHCNKIDSKLQLQVDIFCEDICEGAEQWMQQVLATIPDVQSRTSKLLRIHPAIL